MKLRVIVKADFRRSEWTNYHQLIRKRPELRLRNRDVICFISSREDQVIFVSPTVEMTTGKGETATVMDSRRLRIPFGEWNSLMVADYASMVGIRLEGLKNYSRYYKERKLLKSLEELTEDDPDWAKWTPEELRERKRHRKTA